MSVHDHEPNQKEKEQKASHNPTNVNVLLNQCQGYDIRQKTYVKFFWYLKKIVCVKRAENNSYFIFLMLLLVYIIVTSLCHFDIWEV